VSTPDLADAAVEAALNKGNRKIIAAFLADPVKKGMGSTATLALIDGGLLRVWHIGDARLYLMRQGRCEALTEDHNLAWQLLKLNQITQAQYADHPGRNTLLRCLGKDGALKLDRVDRALQPGDRVLICSDGVNQPIGEAGVADLLGADQTPEVLAQTLIDAALRAGSQDNVSAVVLQIDGDGRAVAAAPAASAAAGSADHTLLSLYQSLDLGEAVARLDTALQDQCQHVAVVLVSPMGPVAVGADDADLATALAVGAVADAWRASGRWQVTTLGVGPGAADVLAVLPAPGADVTTVLARIQPWREALASQAETARLRLAAERGAHLTALCREIAAANTPAEAMGQLLLRCLKATGAEQGAIFVGGDMRPLASMDAAAQAVTIAADRALVQRVLAQRSGVLDVGGTEQTGASVIGFSLVTTLCVPIIVQNDLMGVVYLTANSLIAQLTLDKLRLVEDLVLLGGPLLQMADLLARHSGTLKHFTDSVDRLGTEAGDSRWHETLESRPLEDNLSHALSVGNRGRLAVSDSSGITGSIYLQGGQICHVETSVPLTGLEALGMLLALHTPRLAWHAEEAAPVPSIQGPGVTALIKSLRHRETWRQLTQIAAWDAVPIRLDARKSEGEYPADLAEIIEMVDDGRTAQQLAMASRLPTTALMTGLARLYDEAHIYFERR
jgi:serine/threonine protein phosphatase PrpC